MGVVAAAAALVRDEDVDGDDDDVKAALSAERRSALRARAGRAGVVADTAAADAGRDLRGFSRSLAAVLLFSLVLFLSLSRSFSLALSDSLTSLVRGSRGVTPVPAMLIGLGLRPQNSPVSHSKIIGRNDTSDGIDPNEEQPLADLVPSGTLGCHGHRPVVAPLAERPLDRNDLDDQSGKTSTFPLDAIKQTSLVVLCGC